MAVGVVFGEERIDELEHACLVVSHRDALPSSSYA
jgi:hypothetical protein